jgi:transcriptional regulator with XRE-family HTH domain
VENHTEWRLRNVVGPQVKKYRECRGWSQTTLAAKCHLLGWNVTRDIVATIECRSRWVGDFELVLLARILEVPITELIPDRINWVELDDALR